MKLSNVMTLLEAASRMESVVGIVQSANHWLLGLSTANDDRHNKWVFPGGHIKRNESVEKAVVREVYEETHIKCTPNKTQIILANKPTVAFLHCKAVGQKIPIANDEFIIVGWFTINEMKGLKLYSNVMTLINKVK